MQLSDGEKLILTMLCEVYQHTGIKGEIDPQFVRETISGGHFWGLKWQYPGIFHDHEDSESTVSEVCDILDMWSFIENGYAELSSEDKLRLEKEELPFKFPGFDGNNEGEHCEITRFLIDDLDRFQSFKGRDLNSHHPSIDGYRQMYSVFNPMRATLADSSLGASAIIEILKARIHPENR